MSKRAVGAREVDGRSRLHCAGERPSPRWKSAAAVSCLVSVLAVACGTAAQVANTPLVPMRVPDGLELCSALDGRSGERSPDVARMVIWGDVALPDPWSGPLVGLSAAVSEDLPVHDQARAITVGGAAGYVAPMPLFQAISSPEWGHIVTWREPSGRVIEAAVRGADAAGAVSIAELVDVTNARPALPGDALGVKTSPIYGSTPVAPYGALFSDAAKWTLFYRSSPDTRDGGRLLTIGGLAGTAGDLQPMRFWALTSAAKTIRGRPGLLYATFDKDTGPFGAIWQESPGLLVQVVGLGFDGSAVIDVAESLEPIDATGWQALQRDGSSADCK